MRRLFCFLPVLTVLAVMSSCINSDYDLSDIDTNVRVAVNNLVVPVSIEPVSLDDVLDVKDGSRIEKFTVNGETQYAVIEKKGIKSGAVKINEMRIARPVLATITDELEVKASSKLADIPASFDNYKFSDLDISLLGLSGDTQLAHFVISDAKNTIEFKSDNVDAAIRRIDKIGVMADFRISLSFPGVTDYLSSYHVKNLKVQLPKGLETTNNNYNKETGLLVYNEIDADKDLKVVIELPLTAIDPKIAGAHLEDGEFSFSQEVSAEGEINVYLKDVRSDVKVCNLKSFEKVDYCCNADFASDIQVSTFSGNVYYDVPRPNVAPVNLDDMPEVLTQTGTRIEMTNPQLYLDVTNPIDAKFAVHPKVKLTLIPDVNNESGPFTVKFPLDKSNSLLCFSPLKPEAFLTYADGDFSGATYEAFHNLGKILECNDVVEGWKIPHSIGVEVELVVDQDVTDFELRSYGEVTGAYTFLAPLSLTDKSAICYEKMWDDWDSEDLDNLTVQSATISAVVDSDIPASVNSESVAYLLGRDASGNQVRMKGSVALPANAKDYKLEIKLEGNEISRIYGAEIIVRATGGNAALTSSQKVSLRNVKATVSGYYEKEL